MKNIITETKRLVFKPFSALTTEEKKIVGDSWANPFNARYNAMRDPYGAVEELSQLSQPTFSNFEDYYDCMYFRVAFSKETGQIVATCRFGKYHASQNNDVWDFGFNVLLKDWFKGYGAEILNAISNAARCHGVKKINGGADIENYGSYKAMVRAGYEYQGYDEDGDYRYVLDLSKEMPNKEQIDQTWRNHIARTKKDLGEEKFRNLEYINSKIAEMVKKIQTGEDEKKLVAEYFAQLNDIEEFKFC